MQYSRGVIPVIHCTTRTDEYTKYALFSIARVFCLHVGLGAVITFCEERTTFFLQSRIVLGESS